MEFRRKYCKNDKIEYSGSNAGGLYQNCKSQGTFGICGYEITCFKKCHASCCYNDGTSDIFHAFGCGYYREYFRYTGNRQTCGKCNRDQRYAAFTGNGYIYHNTGYIRKFDSGFIVLYSRSEN